MLEYVGRLLKTYPSFTEAFVLYRLPLDRGWAYYSQAMEMDAWLAFGGTQRVTKGYIWKETEALIKQASNGNGQNNN
jgi:hypothetical protein